MATMRMRKQQLNLIHHSIVLAKKELEKKVKKLKKKIKNKDHYLAHEWLKFEDQLNKLQLKIKHYKALDEMILKAIKNSE